MGWGSAYRRGRIARCRLIITDRGGTITRAGTILIGILCAASPVQAQQSGGNIGTSVKATGPLVTVEEGGVPDPAAGPGGDTVATPGGTSPEAEADAIRAALSREIARMKAEIATLDRYIEWQARLMRTARVDSTEALRQRLPMAECRASFLAPLCDDLTALFAPEEETGGAGGTDPAPATDTGEDMR